MTSILQKTVQTISGLAILVVPGSLAWGLDIGVIAHETVELAVYGGAVVGDKTSATPALGAEILYRDPEERIEVEAGAGKGTNFNRFDFSAKVFAPKPLGVAVGENGTVSILMWRPLQIEYENFQVMDGDGDMRTSNAFGTVSTTLNGVFLARTSDNGTNVSASRRFEGSVGPALGTVTTDTLDTTLICGPRFSASYKQLVGKDEFGVFALVNGTYIPNLCGDVAVVLDGKISVDLRWSPHRGEQSIFFGPEISGRKIAYKESNTEEPSTEEFYGFHAGAAF